MKVLHLISSGGMYGAEAVILNLSHTLNKAGHQSSIAVFANQPSPNLQLYERATQDGLDAHLIPCTGQFDRRVPEAIRACAMATRADVVHAHGYKADVYAYAAVRTTELARVSTCHNWLDNGWTLRVYGALDRSILRRFDGVVAVSEAVQSRLLKAGVSPERVRLIRNGVDLQSFAAAEEGRKLTRSADALRVGIVARLSLEKGVDLFIRAAAEVLRTHPETRFLVAGDGPERPALEELSRQLGISERLSLLGRQDDMPAFYGSIDILVLSSRTEGLPVALLEGMASGLPAVATAVGSVPQVVKDGSTGLLVASEDSAALSDAVTRLISAPGVRDQLSAAGRQLVAEQYSAETMASEYLNLYAAAQARRGRPAA